MQPMLETPDPPIETFGPLTPGYVCILMVIGCTSVCHKKDGSRK